MKLPIMESIEELHTNSINFDLKRHSSSVGTITCAIPDFKKTHKIKGGCI